MRLITWNCHHGDCAERAAELDELQPDIVVLQECKPPHEVESDHVQCFGEIPSKVVAVIARGNYTLERGPVDPKLTHSVFPVRVLGPTCFKLLAVHALERPTYVEAVNQGVTGYSEFLLNGTSIIAGDFNSHSRFDRINKKVTHSMLVERLGREFGLVSAYHAVLEGDEQPSYFHQHKDSQPFHLDYCFVPERCIARILEARIVPFSNWKERSDHHPVLVDIDLPITPSSGSVDAVSDRRSPGGNQS